MIEIIFQFGGEIILVKIDGHRILFGNTSYGARLAPLADLKLSKAGVIKEFPDLNDDIMWREEAIKRFKQHIRRFRTEKTKAKYIIEDLKKHGYQPKRMKENGKREVRIDGGGY